MKYKKWSIRTLLLAILPLLLVVAVNYYIDPLWLTNHSSKYNQRQMVIDERQQKTNFITFNDFDYDTLIIGSSRTTHINQEDFIGHKAYNYSVSAMRVWEYNDYIEYAKKVKGGDFDTIVMELYYDSFEKNLLDNSEDPLHYIDQANSPFYRIKSLLSYDTLKYSFQNYTASTKKEFIETRMYNRKNTAEAKRFTNEEALAAKTSFQNTFTDTPTNYDENYLQTLETLKKNNPNTKFIIFTNPTSDYTLKGNVRDKETFADYERWLTEITYVFDNVYNFAYLNSITTDPNNYYDPYHFYPEVGKLIVDKIMGYSNPDIPSDFGVKIDVGNIDEHLQFVREQLGIDLESSSSSL
ncbi:hypothetical protein [Niallia oryzisoli]|uniref:hypothetical protein n=1 Tax=Niallia oryzisoli TaxID=1737571 RepID=UPI00373628EC